MRPPISGSPVALKIRYRIHLPALSAGWALPEKISGSFPLKRLGDIFLPTIFTNALKKISFRIHKTYRQQWHI